MPNFEGIIGEGEYGGGTVMVWDTGSYRNTTEHKGERVTMCHDGLDRGHVTFSLDGTKLGGEFALTRTRTGPKEQWILVKMRDADASARRDPVKSATKSALSGHAVPPDRDRRAQRRVGRSSMIAATPTAPAPMLATLTDKYFSDRAEDLRAEARRRAGDRVQGTATT